MTKAIDLTGKIFNFLTVLKVFDSKPSGVRWLCLCSCGKQAIVNSLKLRSGSTKSCGCFRKIAFTNKTHGLSNKSTTYRTWKEMRNRCNNPNATQYKWYGGKGITVCKEWNNYSTFLEDMGDKPIEKTIDRLDNNVGYIKTNCRWSTAKEQAENNLGCFKKINGVAAK